MAQQAVVSTKVSSSGAGVDQEKLAEIISAVVFESGIIDKIVKRHLAEGVPAAVDQYAKNQLPQQMSGLVQKAVAEAMSSEDVKELIDSKFRAITLYMKTDLIPSAVKQALSR